MVLLTIGAIGGYLEIALDERGAARYPQAAAFQSARAALFALLETAKPAYLLIIYISTSWYFSQDSNQPLLKWLPGYNEAYYDWVGMAWLLPDRTEYLWGAEALKRSFDTPLRIGILKRKPGV